MSITFFIDGTTYHKETFRMDPTDPDSELTHDVPDEPYLEVNMCNSNACEFLRLVGLEKEANNYCGTLSRDIVRETQRRTLRLLNIENGGSFESATEIEGNFVTIGRSSEYVKRRLTQLLELFKLAITLDREVHFA